MTNRINVALEKLFQKHRIVFWYDEEDSLRKDFDAVEVAGVEKVEIVNNEFGLKYRMLRQEPKQKFLVFKTGVLRRIRTTGYSMSSWLTPISEPTRLRCG
jgi:hypothetical protein